VCERSSQIFTVAHRQEGSECRVSEEKVKCKSEMILILSSNYLSLEIFCCVCAVCMSWSESSHWHWWGRPATACDTLGPRGRLDAGLSWLWCHPIKSMGLGQGLVGHRQGVATKPATRPMHWVSSNIQCASGGWWVGSHDWEEAVRSIWCVNTWHRS